MPVEAGDYHGTIPQVAPKVNYQDNLFTRIQVDLRNPPQGQGHHLAPPFPHALSSVFHLGRH